MLKRTTIKNFEIPVSAIFNGEENLRVLKNILTISIKTGEIN